MDLGTIGTILSIENLVIMSSGILIGMIGGALPCKLYDV